MKTFREPLNTTTHLAGVILSVLGSILLISKTLKDLFPSGLAAVVYGLGLVLLYSASSLYHAYPGNEKTVERLRVLDHSMIYVLIAATYTPVCLVALRSTLGYVLLLCIWLSALGGIVLKATRLAVPRWLYTGIYLILGWASVIVIYPLYQNTQMAAVLLLLFGGISYSTGAVIYAKKNESIRFGGFGYHEIFHLFILVGSFLQYLSIYLFVY